MYDVIYNIYMKNNFQASPSPHQQGCMPFSSTSPQVPTFPEVSPKELGAALNFSVPSVCPKIPSAISFREPIGQCTMLSNPRIPAVMSLPHGACYGHLIYITRILILVTSIYLTALMNGLCRFVRCFHPPTHPLVTLTTTVKKIEPPVASTHEL